MNRRAAPAQALVAIVLASAAPDGRPEPGAPTEVTAPFAAVVRLAPVSPVRWEYDALVHNLPNPTVTVPVGEQARAAHQRMLRAMLPIAPPGAEGLLLEVAVAGAEVSVSSSGGRAVVGHAIALRSAGGVELGRWQLSGESPILGQGPDSVVAAFARAAEASAQRLEERLDASSALAAWLAVRGIAPATGVARHPPPPAPWSFAPAPRAAVLAFLDAGVGMRLAESSATVPALRAGVSWPSLAAAATVDFGRFAFRIRPPVGADGGPGSCDVWTAGLDLAAVRPLTSRVHAHIGLGAHYLAVRASLPYALPGFGVRTSTVSRRQVTGSAFGSLGILGPATGPVGFHGGVEARYLVARVNVFDSDVDVGGLSVGLFLRADLPLSRPPVPAP